ncbi:hypothetical protein [Bacillus sp. ISL-77]|nr:hypothetical protein [Bacillus sp. ISL-77]MBT2740725.1 hypothetical protein [Bacillus sp. ISL-77]
MGNYHIPCGAGEDNFKRLPIANDSSITGDRLSYSSNVSSLLQQEKSKYN